MKRKSFIKKARAHYYNLYKSGKVDKAEYNKAICDLRNFHTEISYEFDLATCRMCDWCW